MSNDIINIRLGVWHLHIERPWKMYISKNEYHRGNPDGLFAVYEFYPFR